MFAEATALLLLVAETLRDRKPLERFFEFAVVCRDNARQRRRELRPHRYFAVAFVGEIEKLPDNFGAAFFCVEFGRLQDRPVPLDEAITTRHFPPFREDIVPDRAFVRQKIAKARQGLH